MIASRSARAPCPSMLWVFNTSREVSRAKALNITNADLLVNKIVIFSRKHQSRPAFWSLHYHQEKESRACRGRLSVRHDFYVATKGYYSTIHVYGSFGLRPLIV